MTRQRCGARADVTWVLTVTGVVIATGMAYSLWWADVVRHLPFGWLTPGDMWSTVRSAHWIQWGSLSYIYSNDRSSLVTLPGFEVVFTPVVALSSVLHLSEVAPGLPGPLRPTAWLLVGPVSLACTALPLVALDAAARRLNLPLLRRRMLTVASSAALWPVVALWGHPEDVVALGLVLFALVAARDRRWAVSGWLFGAALAMQLYVVVLVPVFVGAFGWRKAGAVVARAAFLPGCLAVAVLVPDFHHAWWVLANQPSEPHPNHATPWLALAPTLGHGGLVSGGPGRLLDGAVAIGGGLLAFRWRHDLWRIVWVAALVLSARTVFEAVMVPYYVAPGIALALVAAGRQRLRWLATCTAATGLTVMPFTHHGRWQYWLLLTALTALTLMVAWPGTAAPRRETGHEAHAEPARPLEDPARSEPALALPS